MFGSMQAWSLWRTFSISTTKRDPSWVLSFALYDHSWCSVAWEARSSLVRTSGSAGRFLTNLSIVHDVSRKGIRKPTVRLDCKKPISAVALHPLLPFLAVYSEGTIRIWDLETSTQITQCDGKSFEPRESCSCASSRLAAPEGVFGDEGLRKSTRIPVILWGWLLTCCHKRTTSTVLLRV